MSPNKGALKFRRQSQRGWQSQRGAAFFFFSLPLYMSHFTSKSLLATCRHFSSISLAQLPICNIVKKCNLICNVGNSQNFLRPNFQRYSSMPLAQTDAKMLIQFTCKKCNTTQSKQMSKKAYTTGVVIIQCDGCKNKHLIADHLGWYDSQKPPGTIEQILREKGESVKKLEPSSSEALELVANNSKAK
jgi:hypothetical protein